MIMDDVLAAVVFAVVIGAQFLAVIAARRWQQDRPTDAHRATTPEAARVRHIWLFG